MIYKSLDFLGYPYYKVDEEGNIYRFQFWTSGLNKEQCVEIQEKYSTKNYSQKELAKIFNISQKTISNIIKTNKENLWIKMKPTINGEGRFILTLGSKTNKKQYYLSRIICEAFHGPCPERMECRHLDGNKLNNHYLNLRWGTPKENSEDKNKHGTLARGEKVGTAVLTNEDASMIRYIKTFGIKQKEIAKLYSVSEITISRIVNNTTYKKDKYEN